MHTGRKKVALWAILALWTLVVIEVLTAAYFLLFARTYYRPVYLEKPNDQHLWRTEHHDWGAWHRPSSTANHTANCLSVTYRSNSYGARDRERSLTTAGKRAVMLGDSFVEGFGVEEDKRLSNLLERSFGVEILNFGMTHFGPLQYRILYEKLVRRFDHDAVIIGFLPENDFTDNDAEFNRKKPDFARRYIPYYDGNGGVFYPRSRPGPDEPSPFLDQFARDRPENRSFQHNLYRLLWVYGLYRDIRYSITVLQHPRPASYVGYFETNATRITRAIDTLVAIKEAASPRPVLVVFLPDYESWSYVAEHPGSYEKSVVVGMRAMLERRGLTTLDVLEQWRKRGLSKEDLYLPCDGHWNEAGHQAAFEVIRMLAGDMVQRAALVPRAPTGSGEALDPSASVPAPGSQPRSAPRRRAAHRDSPTSTRQRSRAAGAVIVACASALKRRGICTCPGQELHSACRD